MTRKVAFTNANIVTETKVIRGDVVCEDGYITAVWPAAKGRAIHPIGGQRHAAYERINLNGDYLLPGLVELHKDHLEVRYLPRPNVVWDPLAAVLAHDAQIATAGITTVFDAVRAGTDTESRLGASGSGDLINAVSLASRTGQTRAEHFIHIRCEISAEDAVAQFELFKAHPEVRLTSVMDHTPGQRQFVSMDAFRIYYRGKSGMGEEELEDFITARLKRHHRVAEPNRRAIVDSAQRAGIALASHDDATREHVDEAHRDAVSIAEFPTTTEAAVHARDKGLAVLMGAPNVVRGGSHSGNVSAAELTAEGLCTILSSDYVPVSLLQATFTLARTLPAFSLADAVRMVSANPADAVQLHDRGRIAAGARADLVQVEAGSANAVPVVRGVWRELRRVA